MAGLSKRQVGVAAGMAGGLAFTLFALLWPELPDVPPGSDGRLTLWLGCAAVAGFFLLVSVGRLAGHRFFTPEDIDGGGMSGNTPRAALLQALIQNTLEQTVLAIIAWGAWLWLGPTERGGLVIVFVLAFAAGRLLFFAGYSRGAPFRALGFTLCFYPTVALYLMLLPRIVGAIGGTL
ncbi:MAG: hypothetical protein QOI38_2329 [Sphingomonadales bacterium]|jgi:hypothetical protein|nr:hypothetical protein [Sphingomonadales bacterium]